MTPIRDDTPLQYPLLARVERVELSDDWYSCDGANGHVLAYINPQTPLTQSGETIWLFDPAGIIAGMLLALENDQGEFYLPSGSQVTVWQPPDALDGHFEPLVMGQACQVSSSSGGSPAEPCNTNSIPNASAPTLDNPDQVWARKFDPVSRKWCYGWADYCCPSSSGCNPDTVPVITELSGHVDLDGVQQFVFSVSAGPGNCSATILVLGGSLAMAWDGSCWITEADFAPDSAYRGSVCHAHPSGTFTLPLISGTNQGTCTITFT